MHYEYKELDGTIIPGDVFLVPGGRDVAVSFVNLTDEVRKAKLIKLQGDPWIEVNTTKINIQSSSSIDKYGLKEVEIPLDMIVDPGNNHRELERHLQWVVNTHDGIEGDSASVNLMRQINLTYKITDDDSPFLRPTISDIVQVSVPRLGLNQTRFWVDAADFKVDNQGSLIVKLGLTDARYTAMWPINGMSFEGNTKPGF